MLYTCDLTSCQIILLQRICFFVVKLSRVSWLQILTFAVNSRRDST